MENPLVALAHCGDYNEKVLTERLARLFQAARLRIPPGSKVLIKPNLLMKRELACTNPQVVAAVARLLLDYGARLTIADSPGFGSAQAVARAIGLEQALKPLGLSVATFEKSETLILQVDGQPVSIGVATACLESDLILSAARVKAHSMVRMTLTVKNCFGCVPGLRKAWLHSRYGADRAFFCALLAQLWHALPKVYGVADGVVAMHVTGPSRGQEYPLHLLGASADPPALDQAVLLALGLDWRAVPLSSALAAAGYLQPGSQSYPLEKPQDFSAPGFTVPNTLSSTSFAPLRLAKSCMKRLWEKWRG